MNTRLARIVPAVALLTIGLLGLAAAEEPDPASTLSWNTRQRTQRPETEGQFEIVYEKLDWDAQKTAVVVCDMWDKHWCRSATDRVGQMAPRMNEVLKAARAKGALIIHCPSGTMDFYKDHPARKLAQAAPKVEVEIPLQGWCHLDSEHEAPLPIDDSDGGCPCGDCKSHQAWSRQIDVLEIEQGDAITDSAQAYYLMRQRGIENVLVMGVHTNMCVLGRPFSIRQMCYQGMNVLLMRDMTDTMYNPKMRPQVSHVRGTELVIEHIEKYWCPTVTSSDLLGHPAQRFEEDHRPHVAFLVSDDHYLADKTLPIFAQMLRQRHGLHCTVMHGLGTSDIPHTGELESVDCLVVFVRRLALPKQQLDRLRRYVAAGKPVVGLRTASHAFDTHGKHLEGQDEWPEFDAQVLGGNYHGHEANQPGTDIRVLPDKTDHPILAGVEPLQWHSAGSLYNVSPLRADATLLMTGSLGDVVEPITWTCQRDGGRVAYSALGYPDDFKQPQFRRLLVNMIFWAMDREAPKPTDR